MPQRLTRLAEVSDPQTAQILVARLAAEGIEARLTGEALGPYRLTVGEMAVTELWVDELDLEDARLVMLAAEADAAVAHPETTGAGPSADPVRSWIWWVVAAILLAIILYYRIARFL